MVMAVAKRPFASTPASAVTSRFMAAWQKSVSYTHLFEHPAAVFVFVKDVAVVELVDDGPELGFAVAAKGAEILHAQGVQIAVARFDDGDGLVAGHHAVADVAGGVIGGGGVAEFGVFEPGVHKRCV